MERAERGCIVLQSVVNNGAPARRYIPKNMPVEADACRRTLQACLGD